MGTSYLANGKSAITGTGGRAVIKDILVPRVKTWSINALCSVTEWGDSDSEGYTNRKEARKDATGAVVLALDSSKRIQTLFKTSAFGFLGENAKLTFWVDGTDYYHFPCAMIMTLTMTVNVDTKEVVEANIDWGADGRWYHPGQAGVETQTLPAESATP